MEKNMEKRVSMIAEAVEGLTRSEWSGIESAVNSLFASASSRVKLEDADTLKLEIQRSIRFTLQ